MRLFYIFKIGTWTSELWNLGFSMKQSCSPQGLFSRPQEPHLQPYVCCEATALSRIVPSIVKGAILCSWERTIGPNIANRGVWHTGLASMVQIARECPRAQTRLWMDNDNVANVSRPPTKTQTKTSTALARCTRARALRPARGHH